MNDRAMQELSVQEVEQVCGAGSAIVGPENPPPKIIASMAIDIVGPETPPPPGR